MKKAAFYICAKSTENFTWQKCWMLTQSANELWRWRIWIVSVFRRARSIWRRLCYQHYYSTLANCCSLYNISFCKLMGIWVLLFSLRSDYNVFSLYHIQLNYFAHLNAIPFIYFHLSNWMRGYFHFDCYTRHISWWILFATRRKFIGF